MHHHKSESANHKQIGLLLSFVKYYCVDTYLRCNEQSTKKTVSQLFIYECKHNYYSFSLHHFKSISQKRKMRGSPRGEKAYSAGRVLLLKSEFLQKQHFTFAAIFCYWWDNGLSCLWKINISLQNCKNYILWCWIFQENS